MVHLEEAASLVEEADEVQHRTALGQVQLAGICYWESISYASARAGPKMSPCHGCAFESSGVLADQSRH